MIARLAPASLQQQRCGRRSRRHIAAGAPESDAPPRRQPLRSQLLRRHRRQPRRPHLRQHRLAHRRLGLSVQSTPLIAQWAHQPRGKQIRRRGAVRTTTSDALSRSLRQCRCRCQCQCRCHQHGLSTLTIVLTASPTGRRDGLWARRSGAAGCMERAAQGRDPVAHQSHQHQLLTIAMRALPIGWRDGVHQRRIGVARMPARAAHQP